MSIFYKNGGFYLERSNDAVELTIDEYSSLISGQEQGLQIVSDASGRPILVERKPSVYHEWDGNKWAVSESLGKQLLADKLQQYITAIDNKAAAIYQNWTRFELEYNARKAAAKAYKDAGYKGDVSTYIASFAIPAGLDNKAAADLILVQAAGLQKLQDHLAALRMRKYELKKQGLTLAQMQAIADEILKEMDDLMEAYQNG